MIIGSKEKIYYNFTDFKYNLWTQGYINPREIVFLYEIQKVFTPPQNLAE